MSTVKLIQDSEASVAVGAFLSTFDGGVVKVGLPRMATESHVSMSIIQWVPSAYLLTMSAFMEQRLKLQEDALKNGTFTPGMGRGGFGRWGGTTNF